MVKMEHTYFIRLLILFLGFSFVLSSVAIPTSRSLKLIKEELSVQDLLVQDLRSTDGDLLEDRLMERRMDLEQTSDYPGTGANNNHDPNVPGTS